MGLNSFSYYIYPYGHTSIISISIIVTTLDGVVLRWIYFWLFIFAQVPPEINNSHSVEEISVAIGSSTTLDCDLVRGSPEPVFRWMHEGSLLSLVTEPNIRVQNGGQKLHVFNVQIVDRGSYSCSASNVVGNSSKDFMLNVLGRWPWSISSYNINSNLFVYWCRPTVYMLIVVVAVHRDLFSLVSCLLPSAMVKLGMSGSSMVLSSARDCLVAGFVCCEPLHQSSRLCFDAAYSRNWEHRVYYELWMRIRRLVSTCLWVLISGDSSSIRALFD